MPTQWTIHLPLNLIARLQEGRQGLESLLHCCGKVSNLFAILLQHCARASNCLEKLLHCCGKASNLFATFLQHCVGISKHSAPIYASFPALHA